MDRGSEKWLKIKISSLSALRVKRYHLDYYFVYFTPRTLMSTSCVFSSTFVTSDNQLLKVKYAFNLAALICWVLNYTMHINFLSPEVALLKIENE